MLAFLAVRGRVRRDELISLLWGEIPEDKARNAFRQSLHRLRSLLGDEILPQHRDHVGLEAGKGLQVDRDVFLVACETGQWDAAVQAYGGEFLEGFEAGEPAFDRWADAERVRLRARFQEALLAAGEQASASGRVPDALEYARRLSSTAPFDEAAALFEANTMVAGGRPAQAISVLRQFGDRLRDDLDLPLPDSARLLLDRLEKRASRQSPTSSAAAADRGKTPAFVGRAAELSRMLALAAALRSERGATIVVEGASGIGKSRLLDEFSERVRSLGGVTVLRGREAGLGGVVPYAGVAEALRPLARAAGVAGASRHLLAEAARLLPELRDVFDLPSPAAIEDETGRLRFFEGVAALIDAAAYEKPACMLIDDAQLASSSTLDLLIYLSRRLRQSPVLLVLAVRSDRSAAHGVERLRELAAGDGAEAGDAVIALPPLSPEECRSLASELTRGSPRVSAGDLARIVRLSAGRPFAVVDLARRSLNGESPSEAPVALRDVLWARFQTASPSQRRVFFAASLFDRPSSLHLLAAAAHLPEAAVFEAVDALLGDGLLRATDAGYVLAHDTTTSFLVDSSGLAGRALLAGWAADALAAESDHTSAELAALFAMAGRASETFTCARAGAFDAAAVGASAEVSRLLGMALTFAPTEAARAEIDSLLTAFGRSRMLLPAPEARDTAPTIAVPIVEETEAVAPQTAPSTPREESAPPVRRLWEVGTAGQWALSIAVSLTIVIAGLAARRAIENRRAATTVSDTLFLEERDARGGTTLRAAVRPGGRGAQDPVATSAGALAPAWLDSLRPPFSAPLVAPGARRVALRRASTRGDEVFVVSADRRDTIPLVIGGGDNAALGWSPDGRALLVSRTRTVSGETFAPGLYVYHIGAVGSAGAPTVLDTTASHAVTEASWSPTGGWIAWAARVGASGQRDIFVGRADATEVRNLTANPADDFGATWSPDATLLAFASARSGASRLYVYDFDNARLWTVSDRGGESHPAFSPDGRRLAFESTRDGDLAVYVRPALGGTPQRVTPRGRQFSMVAWRGGTPSYVDRLRIIGPSFVGLGDSLRLNVLSLGPDGRSVPAGTTRWALIDDGPVDLVARDSEAARVVGRALGEARVAVGIPGWRADTLAIAVTSPAAVDVQDQFNSPTLDSRWIPLGAPMPVVGRTASGASALYPNGDLEWESGVLLRRSVELRPGLRVRMRVIAAPGTGASTATLTLGFVPATPAAVLDHVAPRLSPILGVQWDGTSGTFSYTVGAERQADPAALAGASEHAIEISVTPRRDVVFLLDGRERWRSSLRYVGEADRAPVQFWIGGRATTRNVAVSGFSLELPARSTAP